MARQAKCGLDEWVFAAGAGRTGTEEQQNACGDYRQYYKLMEIVR
jgi:hypothetical protein